MAIITIVGAGMMGSAMSYPASDNGHTVRLVGTPLDRDIIEEAKKSSWHKTLNRKLPNGVTYYQADELAKALEGADLLIGGVSSFGVEWFLENVLKKIPTDLPVISITKGLHKQEDGTLIPFPEYYHQQLSSDDLSLNCVGGPCISYELADRHHTQVAFCGKNIDDVHKIMQLLGTDYYHISPTDDVKGLETAVAMKNAYALGVSLAVGMEEAVNGENCKENYNSQAGLFFQSVKEMTKIICLNGGKPETTAFGVGDLYVTIFGGRTRRIGTLLGRGIPYTQAREMLKGVTLESVAIASLAADALKKQTLAGKANIKEFPLLCHINDLLNNKSSNMPWDSFTN